MRRTLLFAAVLLIAFATQAQDTVPLSLARLLADAPSDTSRYHIFRQAHLQALTNGQTLDYSGIDTLHIAIPAGAKPIPLAPRNDFANLVIVVKNTVANLVLFSRTPAVQPILTSTAPDSLISAAIDYGDYSRIPGLDSGRWLLQVVDSTPWVTQRIGHSYGHYREELLRLDNGHSTDRPTKPYVGTVSKPRLKGRRTDSDTAFLFANITLLRDSLSTFKTLLLNIENLSSATLRNITVVTPPSTLTDDYIIRIYHCADVTLDNVKLLGSYSRTNHSGYGLLMDNCRNTRIRRLTARTPWGVFGTNNMHNTLFEYCDFDRFDIHCYGRDVTYRHCRQSNSYNQYSSVYGTILHDSCTFDNFTPLLIETSYNSYPHFTLRMHDCHWRLTRQRHTMIEAGRLDTLISSRPELHDKCLPDIDIDGLTIDAPFLLRPRLVHYRGKNISQPALGIKYINLRRVSTVKGNRIRFRLSDRRVMLSNPVRLLIASPKSTNASTSFIKHL